MQSLTSIVLENFGWTSNVHDFCQPRHEQVLDLNKQHLSALTWTVCKEPVEYLDFVSFMMLGMTCIQRVYATRKYLSPFAPLVAGLAHVSCH